jgi:hypothetical protein
VSAFETKKTITIWSATAVYAGWLHQPIALGIVFGILMLSVWLDSPFADKPEAK